MLSVRAHSHFVQNYQKCLECYTCNDNISKKRKITWLMPDSKKIATQELLGCPPSKLPFEDLPNFLLYIDNGETALINLESFDRINLPTFPTFGYTIIGSSIQYNSQLVTVGHTGRELIIENTNLLTFRREVLCEISINVEEPIVYTLASVIDGDCIYVVDKYSLRIFNLEKGLWCITFAKFNLQFSFGIIIKFDDKLYVFEEIGFTETPIACFVLDEKTYIAEITHSYSPYFSAMAALTAFIFNNRICIAGLVMRNNWQDIEHGTRIVSYRHETQEWTNVTFIQHVGDIIIVKQKMILIEWCTNDIYEYDSKNSTWMPKLSGSELVFYYDYIPRYSSMRSAFTTTQSTEY